MKITNTFTSLSTGLVCGLVLAASASVLHAQWQSPTEPATGGNVALPINVGAVGQVKEAGIAVNSTGASAVGLLVANGSVGVGTLAPLARLDVAGKIVSESTAASDPGNTVVTKDYVDAQSGTGGTGIGYFVVERDSNDDYNGQGTQTQEPGNVSCARYGASCRCIGDQGANGFRCEDTCESFQHQIYEAMCY